MKTTTKFDYPTAAASSYKHVKSNSDKNSENDSFELKKRYQEVIKQEMQNQRRRVQIHNESKQETQKIQNQNKIKSQISKMKKEIEEIDYNVNQSIENQKRAAELAKIKEEQDKIKRIMMEEKRKEDDQNANYRFKDALRRLDAEKDELAYKDKQAQQRRRANLEAEKVERNKAIKYQKFLQEKELKDEEQRQEEQKKNFEMYKNGLSRHGYSKKLDYTKTCLHNPRIAFRNEEEDPQSDARVKGQKQQQKRQRLSQQKKQNIQEMKRRSFERGQNAMQRINREREYYNYCKQTQKQQVSYNLERIQVGKKNQYTGLKPLTLSQMETNKKLRSEQQFEDMFISKPNTTSPAQNATKYQVYETKMAEQKPQQSNFRKWKKEQVDYRERESLIPNVSQGKYEFEQASYNEDDDLQIRQVKVEPTKIENRQQQNSKIRMAETGFSEAKKYSKRREEDLSYSQSEDSFT